MSPRHSQRPCVRDGQRQAIFRVWRVETNRLSDELISCHLAPASCLPERRGCREYRRLVQVKYRNRQTFATLGFETPKRSTVARRANNLGLSTRPLTHNIHSFM